MKILIVDDNFDFRSTLIEYFRSKDYDVYGAENGHKALKMMNLNHYDIVLLDLNMPMMNGMETMEEIRKKAGDIHIIIVTGKENPEKYYYYNNGCILFEKKPVDIIELELKVRNIVNALNKRNKKLIPDHTSIDLDINTIYDFIIDHIDDYNLNAQMISDSLGIKKKQLYARIEEVLTISVHDIIKNFRLLKANQLIKRGEVRTIKELSMSVGYRDAGYFSKLYKKAFEIDPGIELSCRGKKLKIKY